MSIVAPWPPAHDIYRDQITAVQLAEFYRGNSSDKKAVNYSNHPMFGRGTLRQTMIDCYVHRSTQSFRSAR